LAVWAVKTAPLRLGDVFNGCAAYATRFTTASVHVERLLEVAGAAFGADKVAQRGASLLDGAFQQAFDMHDEALIVCKRQAVAGAARVDVAKK